MFRRLSTILLFVLMALSISTISQVSAAGDSVSVGSQVSNGCSNGNAKFQIHFTVSNLGGTYTVRTIATAGGQTYMDEQFSSSGSFFAAKTVWGIYDINSGGTQTARMPIPANTPINVTIYFAGTTASFSYQCNAFFSGPPIPNGFVLRVITCDVAVFDSAGGNPVATGEKITSGQTWFVNPIAAKDAKGKAWTEVFVSGTPNGFIPTSCVSGKPAGYGGN